MDAKLKWILAIVLLAGLGYLAYIKKDEITVALGLKEKPLSGTSTTTTTSTATSKTAPKFPVSPSSPPADIMEAFKQSGYWASLQASVDSGLYPRTYLEDAQKDPAKWLANHPYLYTAYPQYFKPS